jgi:hypothetical protein
MKMTTAWSAYARTGTNYLLLIVTTFFFLLFISANVANAQCSTPPTITNQPVGGTKCEGENFTFNVAADNAADYEWQLDGQLLADGLNGNGSTVSGQGTPSLTISNLCSVCNAGSYTVDVYGSGLCAADFETSQAAVLVINKAPEITTQPASAVKCEGENVTFNVAVTNPGGYEWLQNGVPVSNGPGGNGSTISGQGTSSLTISNLCSTCNSGTYSVRAIGVGGCSGLFDLSQAATLTINEPPTITTQPIAATKCEGESVTFNVVATSVGSYEWLLNGTPISNGPGGNGSTLSGQGTSSLTISNLCSTCNSGDYSVRITGSGSCSGLFDLSQAATLIINEPPVITTQPVAAVKCEGESVTFTSGATNAGSYEWLLNGTPISNGPGGNGSTISGQGTSSLTISNLCSTCNSGDYSVRVKGAGGCSGKSVTSQVAKLKINEKLFVISQPQLSQGYCDGTDIELSILVTGVSNTFQWFRNNQPIIGQTNATYSFTTSPELNGSTYQVRAFGPCDDVTSETRTLFVRDPGIPTIKSNKATTVCIEEPYILSVDGCAATAGVQWFKDGNFASAENAFLTKNIGNYTVRCVLEGCLSPFSEAFVVGNYPPVTAKATATAISCFGRSDGSVEVSEIAGGGSPNYVITWAHLNNTQASNNPNKAEFLPAGTYPFTVTTPQGCTLNSSGTIDSPPQVFFSATGTNPSCFGESTGNIAIRSNGGRTPLKYSVNGGVEKITPTSDFDILNLSASGYQLNVTDNNNCPVGNITINLDQPAKLTLTNLKTTTPKGAFSNDGSAQATINGGTIPYNPQWLLEENQISENVSLETSAGNSFLTILSEISGGNYSLRVTDAKGCTESIKTQIIAPDPILISATVDSLKCNGDSTAAISVSVSGGVITAESDYKYNWSALSSAFASTSTTVSKLTAGTYTLVVTDANDISVTKIVELQSPEPLTLSLNRNIADYCPTSSKGKLSFFVANAKGELGISWADAPTVSTLNRTDLAAGNYQLKVTDGNGCTDAISATVTETTSDFKGTIAYTPPSCNDTEDATLIASVSGGVGAYTYNWSALDISSSSPKIENFNPSAPSTQLSVIDTEGCTVNVATADLPKPEKREVVLPASKEICPSKPFTIEAGNDWGGNYQWLTPLNTTLTTKNISGDTTGTYQLTITDAKGCKATGSISLIPLSSVKPLFSSPGEAPVNEEVVFVDLTSPFASAIEWQFPAIATLVSQTEIKLNLRFTKTGTFKVRLLSTVNDCTFPFEKEIVILDEFDDGGFEPPLGIELPLNFTILNNPTNSKTVRFEFNQLPPQGLKVTLTDLNGKVVYSKNLDNNAEKVVRFPFESPDNRAYILSVIHPKKVISKRLFMLR